MKATRRQIQKLLEIAEPEKESTLTAAGWLVRLQETPLEYKAPIPELEEEPQSVKSKVLPCPVCKKGKVRQIFWGHDERIMGQCKKCGSLEEIKEQDYE